jgi:membrane protease YdiL (CAAX protease family)
MTPRPFIGVLVLATYLAVFYGIWIVNGVDYGRIGESASTILRWYVAPLAGGAVVLTVAASALGWWRPALFEKERAPRWLIASPVFMAVGAVVILLSKDYTRTTAAMLFLLVVGSLLVGFCEELATRGLLLVGLRARCTEGWAWFLSTLLFGLLHLPNWAFGVGPGATGQVVLAFGAGTALYLARRTTGSLIWAMLIHGLWDFAAFIGSGAVVLSPVLVVANGLLGLTLVAFSWKGRRPALRVAAKPRL